MCAKIKSTAMSGNNEVSLVGASHLGSKESQNIANASSSVEDLFILLESSSKASVVQEIKQLINEQYSEVKEPWLVNGLYDTFCLTKSPKVLELLLDVRKDPHDRFLCDKICDALRQRGKQRALGLEVLGYIIRKQPSWLYRILDHNLMKQWIKVLKTEDDIVILMSGILNLLAFLPAVPGNLSNQLSDIFDVFSRLASWRLQWLEHLPDIQQIHLDVVLYAYFHRVFGMFPCNFLSYLRSNFSNQGSKNSQAIFTHVIRPIMSSVRMHPLLVTNTREYEKSVDRWKRMEVHDVVVESSRISLLSQESSREETLDIGGIFDSHEVPPASPFLSFPFAPIPAIERNQHNNSQVMSITTVTTATTITRGEALIESKTHDQNLKPNLSSGRLISSNTTSPGNHTTGQSISRKNMIPARLTVIESPPEPAIEATPESTPFDTPVKEDIFRYSRALPSSQVARQLNLDASPGSRSPLQAHKISSTSDNSSNIGAGNTNSVIPQTPVLGSIQKTGLNLPVTTPTSPLKDASPFRFPELPHHVPTIGGNLVGSVGSQHWTQPTERRDSLFERTDQLVSRMVSQSSTRQGSVERVSTFSAPLEAYSLEIPASSGVVESDALTRPVILMQPSTTGEEARHSSERYNNESAKMSSSSLSVSSSRPMINIGIESPDIKNQLTKITPIVTENLSLEQLNNSDQFGNIQQKDISSLAQYRPSPVKFTNQRPEQFPVKPKPERLPLASKLLDANESNLTVQSKQDGIKSENMSKLSETQMPILSLETLKDFTDFGKEEVNILNHTKTFILTINPCLYVFRVNHNLNC